MFILKTLRTNYLIITLALSTITLVGCLNSKENFYPWNTETIFSNRTMLYNEESALVLWLFKQEDIYEVYVGDDDGMGKTVFITETVGKKNIVISQTLGEISYGPIYNTFEIENKIFGRDFILSYSPQEHDFVKLAEEFNIEHLSGSRLVAKTKGQFLEIVSRIITNENKN